MIRSVETEADLELCVEILNAVQEQPIALEELRPVRERLLLHPGGGYAYVDHSSVKGSAYAMVRVRPADRRKGIGSELVEAATHAASALGAGSAWGRVEDDASLSFAMNRGFDEVARDVDLSRRLVPGEGTIPDAVVELRDEHREAAYAVAVECVPDMPHAGATEAREFEEWVKRELSGPVVFVALEGDEVIGYATLQSLAASPKRLEHGLTAVRRGYRRRGFATALGRAQIAWAAARGYEELVTTTDVTNTALRRQKAKLGYTERTGPILVRGPV